MFCPACGQQQANEVRFCSRCGLPLGGVNELLLTGGQAAGGLAAREPQAMSPRRKGVRQGAGLALLGLFLVPTLAILHELIGVSEKAPLIGVLVIFVGLLRLLAALFFAPSAPRPDAQVALPAYAPPAGAHDLGAARQHVLAPAQSAYAYRPPPGNTAEMAPPPSVTEHTTRLLDQQADEPRSEH